jgi:hypothetical protein
MLGSVSLSHFLDEGGRAAGPRAWQRYVHLSLTYSRYRSWAVTEPFSTHLAGAGPSWLAIWHPKACLTWVLRECYPARCWPA